MKKTLLILLTSFTLLSAINAQVSNYSFSSSVGTYTAITGGTVLGDTTNDDERFVDPSALAGSISTLTGVGFPIGFDFTFNGQIFDRFAVNTNGWISLGQSYLTPSVSMLSFSSYTALSSSTIITPAVLRNRIAGFNDDMAGQIGSELRIETIGAAPNRICVVQWKNYRKFYNTGDNFNFQIRLKETSNVVEFIYGAFTNNSTLSEAHVGLGGETAADFNSRKTSTNWSATTASSANSNVCYITATITPALGLTFTWATPGSGCIGIPTAGTASASTDSICAGTSFSLTLTGYTNVSGITLQWQSSSTLGGTYTDILGATTATYSTMQAFASYYKCVVTCSGFVSASSNVVLVNNNSGTDCYCASQASSIKDEEIANVTVGTLNNSSSCSQTGGVGSVLGKYSNYTTSVSTPTIAKGATVNFSVQIDTCNPTSPTVVYSNAIKIFIDYNQNGLFTDTLEMVYVSDTAKGPQTITGIFVVPTVATNGNTRMRIICVETLDAASISSCGTYTGGETEDYIVNITGGSDVGVEENALFSNVSIYPNPSTGLFNIVANNAKAEIITVHVLDIQGKVMYSVSDKSTSINYTKSINLEGLAKGLYYIKLTSESGSKVQKIVIQ